MGAQVLTSVITATPFRLSFFGGGTDFPAYFNRRGGLVLATALRQFSYVALNSLERLLEKRFRVSYSQLENVEEIEEIRHDIARTVLAQHRQLIDGSFVDIHSYADLPSGTGIGSSSSFCVGMLNALHALNGVYLPPKELARRAVWIERECLGEVGGWQDQITAAYGGFNAIRFRDGDFEVEPLVLSAERRAALERSCRLYFTATRRSSNEVQAASFSRSNMRDKEKTLDATRELAEEALQIWRGPGEGSDVVRRWGGLLDRAWALKRSMSDAVSPPAIDALYTRAKEAGAYGGKIVGAGGGGFLLIIAPPESRPEIDAALGNLHCLPVRFEMGGSHVVYAQERLAAEATGHNQDI